jgi:hypothetical protein
VAILLLGVALYLPSVGVGFLLDDYYYLSELDGVLPGQLTGDEFFAFFAGDPEQTARLASEGVHPWWIDDELAVRVFRPLAAGLFRLEHGVFGHDPRGYHVHSLVWWVLTLLMAGVVLRRSLPGTAGTLAFLVFALDEAHALPVAWIANRNALLALSPVLCGLWALMRWREEGWRPGRWLLLLGTGVGLLASEVALAALAYVFAYGLWGGVEASLRSRLRDLTPLGLLVVGYLVFYRVAGYGIEGSDLYLDPQRDPFRYLAAAAVRIPTLLGAGIAGFSADLWIVEPAIRPIQVVVGIAMAVALAWVLRRRWVSLDQRTRRTLSWLLAGTALSLLPAVATFPSDRMLLVPGLGLAGILAVVMVEAWCHLPRRRWFVAVGVLLVCIHLMLAPVYGVLVQLMIGEQARVSLDLAASTVLEDTRGREVVVIFAPDYVVGLYLPGIIAFREGEYPTGWRTLSIAPYDHVLRRPEERTLELEVGAGGVMLRSVFGMLYRSAQRPLRPGDVLDRGLIRAEILAANAAGPTRVAFRFDRDLTDPSLVLLTWRDGELQEALLPDVGQELVIERTLGPVGF